jgi:hypothetical protein
MQWYLFNHFVVEVTFPQTQAVNNKTDKAGIFCKLAKALTVLIIK